ncbi:carbon-nitrogen hydrolase [Pseudomonas aeruginosa PA38182]|nr:carbon-nitrogen hydrolase [Pseudomonas aeruginosa PA38182]
MTLIAAAQSCAHPADLPRNLDDHLRLMRIAQARGVRLLVFPELSLTGYEPSAAAALAQPADTPLLQPLRQLAEQARMTTVVGLPLRSPKHAKPLIAALILGATAASASMPSSTCTRARNATSQPATAAPCWRSTACRWRWRSAPTSANPATRPTPPVPALASTSPAR